jgi:hypothetical protein
VKEFTSKDVDEGRSGPRIDCMKEDLVYDPPAWLAAGLQETASGYGKRLNSGYKIHYMGVLRRIYTTIYSNNGTCWFMAGGEKIIVNA